MARHFFHSFFFSLAFDLYRDDFCFPLSIRIDVKICSNGMFVLCSCSHTLNGTHSFYPVLIVVVVVVVVSDYKLKSSIYLSLANPTGQSAM